jgi:hypothetical protein
MERGEDCISDKKKEKWKLQERVPSLHFLRFLKEFLLCTAQFLLICVTVTNPVSGEVKGKFQTEMPLMRIISTSHLMFIINQNENLLEKTYTQRQKILSKLACTWRAENNKSRVSFPDIFFHKFCLVILKMNPYEEGSD